MENSQVNPRAATLGTSPYAQLLGLRIESASDGAAVVRMKHSPNLLNAGNAIVHGGATASLIDLAAAAAACTLPDVRNTATISMTVNYTRAGQDSDLVAHAQVRSHGRRIASVTIEVRDKADALIADGLITYKIG